MLSFGVSVCPFNLNAFEVTFILCMKPIVSVNVTVQYAQTFTMLLQN